MRTLYLYNYVTYWTGGGGIARARGASSLEEVWVSFLQSFPSGHPVILYVGDRGRCERERDIIACGTF